MRVATVQAEASKERMQRLRQERGWTLWLIPKRVDLVTSAFYLSMPIFFFFYNTSATQTTNAALWWREGGIIGATLILLSIDRLEYWFYDEAIPTRTAAFLLLARIIFIEIIAQLDSFRFSPFLYLLIPLIAILYFGNLPGSVLACFAWMTYLVKHMLNSPGWLSNPVEIQYFVIFTLGLVFSITMALVVVRERASKTNAERLLAELEVSHRQLTSYAEQVEELAIAKERNRLARDIHDSLGHYLTVINVQLEKALVFRDKKPQEADQAIHDAKGLASEALQDVRRSVSALRAAGENFSTQRSLRRLIEHLQDHQLAIELQVEGSEAGFSQEALVALYRAAQEGLTNVQKHAMATRVRIELRFGEQEATMRLSDNGRGFDTALLRRLAPGREGGYGLQGVQERMELIGGYVILESAPGSGTHLLAGIAKEPPAHTKPLSASVSKEGHL